MTPEMAPEMIPETLGCTVRPNVEGGPWWLEVVEAAHAALVGGKVDEAHVILDDLLGVADPEALDSEDAEADGCTLPFGGDSGPEEGFPA